MPRTRAQRRATQGLFALGDDPLRNALTFLSISDCVRGPGETSRALREVSMSKHLQAARTSGSYVLRGDKHGVVLPSNKVRDAAVAHQASGWW